MRTLLVALLVSFSASPAQAAELRLKRLAVSHAPPVVSARSGGLAYLISTTVLRVRRHDSAARAYAVPAGCRPTAMGTGVVALTCPVPGIGAGAIAVLREADGTVVALPRLDGRRYYHLAEAIGKHWLSTSGNEAGDDPRIDRNFLVAWRTGRAIELESNLGPAPDPLRPDEYADLDAREPVRRLCAPLFRAADTERVEPIGQWVAKTHDSGWALQRCGETKILRSSRWVNPVLGRDVFAYLLGRRIVLRDLRSDRRLTGVPPTKHRPWLAMYGRRLVVIDRATAGAGPYSIYLGPRDF